MPESITALPDETIGVDLGDRTSQLCVLNREGQVTETARIQTTTSSFQRFFGGRSRCRVAIETGTHSPWVSRLLSSLGFEVFVANARKLRLIYENRTKSDRVDAEYLARVARLDPELLAPIQHTERPAQVDLAVLKSRDVLVRARTQLINHSRGCVKSLGERLPSCSADSFAGRCSEAVPDELLPALAPVLEMTAELTDRIKRCDRLIDRLAETYPATCLFRQVAGVGPITPLAYRLLLEDPQRFPESRSVGAYLGLTPGSRESGDSKPQCGITKEGNEFLRQLLVQAAHYILEPFGPDCDLRRHGERIAARGGPIAKKKATVAVARKLAVLLHRLWLTGEDYEPLRNHSQAA